MWSTMPTWDGNDVTVSCLRAAERPEDTYTAEPPDRVRAPRRTGNKRAPSEAQCPAFRGAVPGPQRRSARPAEPQQKRRVLIWEPQTPEPELFSRTADPTAPPGAQRERRPEGPAGEEDLVPQPEGLRREKRPCATASCAASPSTSPRRKWTSCSTESTRSWQRLKQ